jgi:hypothetical protein
MVGTMFLSVSVVEPHFPTVGIDIVVNWDDVIRQTSLTRFKAHKELCPNVGKYLYFFIQPPDGLIMISI